MKIQHYGVYLIVFENFSKRTQVLDTQWRASKDQKMGIIETNIDTESYRANFYIDFTRVYWYFYPSPKKQKTLFQKIKKLFSK